MIDLKTILKQHPNCLNSRASFKSVLMDQYPMEKRVVNILTILFECGIAHKIQSKITLADSDIQALTLQLENEYGIPPKYSLECLSIWATAFDIPVQFNISSSTPLTAHEPIIHAPIEDNVVVEGCQSDYETLTLEDGTLSITKFVGFDEKEITVPNQINGVKVTSIGENAFALCSGIERIVVSEGITQIKNGAFFDCLSLADVVLPESLEKLGSQPSSSEIIWGNYKGVFENCAIKSLDLPYKLNFVGRRAFRGCKRLAKINLPNAIKKIPAQCFEGCSSLQEVLLPDKLTHIRESAFRGTAIENIKVPPSVTEIEKYAFDSCQKLSKVTLYEGLLKIGPNAFQNCTSLCELKLPRSITAIGPNAFDIESFYNLFAGRRKSSKDLVVACYSGSFGLEYARKAGFKIKNAAK